jgi:hypothetical protein
MHRITRRFAATIVVAGALAGAFFAGAAYAADGRIALADGNAEKAIALLKAAQNPTAKDPRRPFGGHRDRAVRLLEHARKEMAAAKAYADDPKNQKGKPSTPIKAK